jgi:hypothetical protein
MPAPESSRGSVEVERRGGRRIRDDWRRNIFVLFCQNQIINSTNDEPKKRETDFNERTH